MTRLTRRAEIVGWGMYVPQRVVTNDDLAQTLDTSDEWIRSRTGIEQRYIAGPHENTTQMAIEAAHAALRVADADPREIDLIIVATATPNHVFPSSACAVQNALGAIEGRRFRPQRRLLRLCLWPDHGAPGHRLWRAQPGTGDRIGNPVASAQLGGPFDLRALWRWRRRGAAASKRGSRRRPGDVPGLGRLGGPDVDDPGGGKRAPRQRGDGEPETAHHPNERPGSISLCYRHRSRGDRARAQKGRHQAPGCRSHHSSPGKLCAS